MIAAAIGPVGSNSHMPLMITASTTDDTHSFKDCLEVGMKAKTFPA